LLAPFLEEHHGILSADDDNIVACRARWV